MNYKLSFTYLYLIISLFVFGCGGPAKEEKKKDGPASSISLHVGDEKHFTIDTKESVISWMGSSLEGKHDGYSYISKGELLVENDQLAGGTVEIDMNKSEGPGHDKDNNLINHLKSPDFFDVEKFPFSTIVITRVATINGEHKTVTGNLTIKGIKRPVIFPARIQVEGGTIKAEANLTIDRTDWGIRYKSGKFYDNLADKAISDSIEFNIKILAKK
ncbi:YceI family protein [uncultured Chitinophaga sp.]|uniref:YceI family protein n=1 Tax=uncultured Chitinophaga sp. TaxID=339340 RepID=UPI0025DE3A92|nr:YceI family protein [uncultured Chitinophaga sp.]